MKSMNPDEFVKKILSEIDQRRDLLGALREINVILDNKLLDPLSQITNIVRVLREKDLR